MRLAPPQRANFCEPVTVTVPTLGRTSRPVRWKYSAAEEKSKRPDKSAAKFWPDFPRKGRKQFCYKGLINQIFYWFVRWYFCIILLIKLFQKTPFTKGSYSFFQRPNFMANFKRNKTNALVSICRLIHGANSFVLKMSNFLYSNSLEKNNTFYDIQDDKNVENHEYFVLPIWYNYEV